MTRSRIREGWEFRFNGAHTVNVYRDGKNVDCFSVGVFSLDRATDDDIERGIKAWLRLHRSVS